MQHASQHATHLCWRLSSVRAETLTYCWPLEPFDSPHPVRAYFNDPRIAEASEAFHFGIDISAPNGTPVYAVEAGVVHL